MSRPTGPRQINYAAGITVGESAFLRNIPGKMVTLYVRLPVFTNSLDSACTRWIGEGVIGEVIKQ